MILIILSEYDIRPFVPLLVFLSTQTIYYSYSYLMTPYFLFSTISFRPHTNLFLSAIFIPISGRLHFSTILFDPFTSLFLSNIIIPISRHMIHVSLTLYPVFLLYSLFISPNKDVDD